MALTLQTLPPPLFAHVLEFSVYGFTQDLGPHERSMPLDELQNLALVSKTTLNLLRDIASHYQNSTMNLKLEDSTTMEDVAALQQKVEARGSAARDLRVQLGPLESMYSTMNPGPGVLENLDINWANLFGRLPGLKRLDLIKIPLLSRHVPEILEAASTLCLQIEFLILPRKSELGGFKIDKVMTTLNTALERWHMKGFHGGLRQLTVPSRCEEDRFRSSTTYINCVTQFCPRIEHLDGLEAQSSEKWFISLDTWAAFNATCRDLREFTWSAVPFADSFFRVFGETVKSHLTALCLSANSTWNYNQYLRECNDPNVLLYSETCPPGYGEQARDVVAVLRGCPALQAISLDINFHRNESPEGRYVNPDLFGDAFWETAARQCPLLENIEMMDSSDYQNFRIRPIDTLTDRSLAAFAGLKWLSSVELPAGRMTGDGVFQYLCNVSKAKDTIGDERMLGIKVGGHQRGSYATPTFYAEIVKLLKMLSEITEEELGAVSCRQKPLLYISNPYESMVNRLWCATYMRDQLKPLLASVKAAHPSLRMNVVVYGRTGDRFNRIETLTLDWRPGTREQELFIDMMEEDAEFEMYADAARYEVVSDDEDMSY